MKTDNTWWQTDCVHKDQYMQYHEKIQINKDLDGISS